MTSHDDLTIRIVFPHETEVEGLLSTENHEVETVLLQNGSLLELRRHG